MYILCLFLILILVLDIVFVTYVVLKYQKKTPKTDVLHETAKVAKSIFLSNSSESVDLLIDTLKKEDVTIEFVLEGQHAGRDI